MQSTNNHDSDREEEDPMMNKAQSVLGAWAYQPWFPPYLSIAISGALLGALSMMAVMFIMLYLTGVVHTFALVGLGFYILVSFVMFHASEFACAVFFRPHDCHPDSFLFFHSVAFMIAHSLAWLELIVRWFVYGDSQWSWPRILIFAAVSIYFYSLRVRAMVDAGDNFSFKVETEKRTSHRLVKTGVFSWLRHPSYFGSFYFFLAVQAMAGNWVCFLLFIIVLRFFFKQRIENEEILLESSDFFGEEYTKYKKETIVGLPILNKWPFFC